MKIRAVIVDDEPLARELIRELLATDPEIEIVDECPDGPAALEALTGADVDLLFLDVQMPGMTGFEMLSRVDPTCMPYVVFVTAYDRYALQAFEVQAVDYLLKPFRKRRFHESLERAKQAIRDRGLAELAGRMTSVARSYAELQASIDAFQSAEPSYRAEFPVRVGNVLKMVAASEVRWFEAANQYVKLHTEAEVYLLSTSMTALLEELDPARFCRIHRSTIVNSAYVHKVRADKNGAFQVVLGDGRRLRLSRGRRDVLTALLKNAR